MQKTKKETYLLAFFSQYTNYPQFLNDLVISIIRNFVKRIVAFEFFHWLCKHMQRPTASAVILHQNAHNTCKGSE